MSNARKYLICVRLADESWALEPDEARKKWHAELQVYVQILAAYSCRPLILSTVLSLLLFFLSLSGNLFMELLWIGNLFPWGPLSFTLARRVCVRQSCGSKRKTFLSAVDAR